MQIDLGDGDGGGDASLVMVVGDEFDLPYQEPPEIKYIYIYIYDLIELQFGFLVLKICLN
ncbi:hypothetical protein HYC85_013611 [Camellia sinensis]|uniref:Uncharacterized protein n=1 Tax=Camellia sinensis TaxID=4442 RepID=A0A7J7H6Z8_CAMSI|nr:hypothetical protein HYC85_013611 [Camellia sinensis]